MGREPITFVAYHDRLDAAAQQAAQHDRLTKLKIQADAADSLSLTELHDMKWMARQLVREAQDLASRINLLEHERRTGNPF